MHTKDTTLEQFEQTFEQWKDVRVVPRDDLHDVALLLMQGPAWLSQFGLLLNGLSFRQYREDWRLAVKVEDTGTPQVAFVTAPTTTGCVTKFLDLLEKGNMRWQTDKYP